MILEATEKKRLDQEQKDRDKEAKELKRQKKLEEKQARQDKKEQKTEAKKLLAAKKHVARLALIAQGKKPRGRPRKAPQGTIDNNGFGDGVVGPSEPAPDIENWGSDDINWSQLL